MLTKRHLAVLRAALQFFDEEMTPHGAHALRHYFDKPLREALKPEEVRELRDLLRRSELLYACYDPIDSRLIGPELSATAEAALAMATTQNGMVATVVLPLAT